MCWSLQGAARHQCVAFLRNRKNILSDINLTKKTDKFNTINLKIISNSYLYKENIKYP